MNKVIKKLILFIVGFCVYITIETLFRGYSFPIMGICGGIAILLLDMINDKISWDTDITIQCCIGAMIVVIMELFIGTLSLNGVLPVMWDYSNIPLNYNGIICLPFTIAWFFLSFIGIVLADAINYYVFEDTILPYYKFMGKRILTFKEKKCKTKGQ